MRRMTVLNGELLISEFVLFLWLKKHCMEDNKPIIFDDGLRDAFEHPLKKYPKLQKVILEQPDESDKKDVFLTKLQIPYVSVMWYLCTHDSAVFDAFLDFIEIIGVIEGIPRLTTNEVFVILSTLSSRNASILLSKIDCTDGVYSELIDSLKDGDNTRFVAALKDCNSTPINPALKILQKAILIKEELKKMEFYLGVPQKNREEFLSKIDHLLDIFERELFEFGSASEESNDFVQGFAIGVKAAKQHRSTENNNNEYVAMVYDFMVGLFCGLKREDTLNDDAIAVMEYILKQPPFENEYYRCQMYWEKGNLNDRIGEFLARHSQLLKVGITKNKDEKLIANDWPLPDDFFEPAYIDDDCPQNEYFPEFLENLPRYGGKDVQNSKYSEAELRELSRLFSEFINKLASKGYIQDDKDTKLALAHALTGRRVISTVKRVEWRKPTTSATPLDHQNSISYLIRTLYPKNINSLGENGSKYAHILTVFDGLKDTSPGSNAADNIRKSKIKEVVEDFLDAVMIIDKGSMGKSASE